MKRRYAAAIVLAVSSTLAFSGCSASSTPTDAATITMMVPFLEAQPPAANDTIQKKLEAATGSKIAINWVPNSSYEDKTNIVLAGATLPDVMVIQGKSPGFVKNANAGAFWDLTDKLKDYPNLTTTSPAIQQNSSVNGKVYGVYRARDAMRTAVILRKDWLDKLGLAVPKTTADLYAVAKAFTNDDPDGDGVKDTYGLIIPKWPGSVNSNSTLDVFSTWFGAGNGWRLDSGKLVPNFTTKEFIAANTYAKKFVDEGLVNPDYATMDSATWSDPFFNGKGGIIVDVQSRAALLVNLFKQQNPTDYQKYVEITGNLAGPSGKILAQPTDGYSGFLAIPRAQVKTEAELKTVLTFLDKLNAKKSIVLVNNGIEGVNFTSDGGLAAAIPPADLTPQGAEVTEAIKSYAQLGTNVAGIDYLLPKLANGYDQQMNVKRLAIQDADLKHAVYNPAAAYVSATQVAKGAQLDNIVSDARIQFLAGQITEKQFEAAVALWRSSGGNEIIAETNALYKADK